MYLESHPAWGSWDLNVNSFVVDGTAPVKISSIDVEG